MLSELRNLCSDAFLTLLVIAVCLSEGILVVFRCLDEEHVIVNEVDIIDLHLLLFFGQADWNSVDGRVGVIGVLFVHILQV